MEELAAIRQTLQTDLETSIRRIADLQAALEEVASSDSDTERCLRGAGGAGLTGGCDSDTERCLRGAGGAGHGGGCALGALRSSVGRAPLSSLGARGFRRTVGGRITGWLRRAEAGCSPLVVPSLLWSWAGDRCSEADCCRLPREGVHFQHQCDTDPVDLPCSGL